MFSMMDLQNAVVEQFGLPEGSMLTTMPMPGYLMVAVPLTREVLGALAQYEGGTK